MLWEEILLHFTVLHVTVHLDNVTTLKLPLKCEISKVGCELGSGLWTNVHMGIRRRIIEESDHKRGMELLYSIKVL
jgi:hypothetical protein